MISLSIQTLTLERYITFAKRFMTFTHAQFMQMMGLAVILFVICLMYQTQQHGWKGLLVRLPKELLISLWTAFIVGLTLINRIEGTSDDMIFNPLTTLRVALHGDIFEQFQTLSNVAL